VWGVGSVVWGGVKVCRVRVLRLKGHMIGVVERVLWGLLGQGK
jgi:hypothetical protein